jgi:hypothetical protein
MKTRWAVESFGWAGWELLYHHRIVDFCKKADAEEYVRLYKSIKK